MALAPYKTDQSQKPELLSICPSSRSQAFDRLPEIAPPQLLPPLQKKIVLVAPGIFCGSGRTLPAK